MTQNEVQGLIERHLRKEKQMDEETKETQRKRVRELFAKHDNEHLQFENIPPERRLSNRPDLHAFIVLDKLVPGDRDLIARGTRDEIYLSARAHDLGAAVADEIASALAGAQVRVALDEKTLEEIVLDLVRCGIGCDDEGWLYTLSG